MLFYFLHAHDQKKSLASFRAFTLLETIVAIGLLALALIGPMTLAHNMLQSARTTKGKLTATYLAQDAMEHIKALRDTNAINGVPWLSGFDSCTSPNGCTVDTITGDVVACPGACGPLHYSTTGYYYGHNGAWRVTPYTRKMTVTQTVADVEARVDVTVSWQEEGVPYSVTFSRYFYNY